MLAVETEPLIWPSSISFSSLILSSISREDEAIAENRFAFWSFTGFWNSSSSRLLKSSKRNCYCSYCCCWRMICCLVDCMTCCFSDWTGFLNLGISSKSFSVVLLLAGSTIIPFWSNLTTRRSLSVLLPVLIFSKKLRVKRKMLRVNCYLLNLPWLIDFVVRTRCSAVMSLFTVQDVDDLTVLFVAEVAFWELEINSAPFIIRSVFGSFIRFYFTAKIGKYFEELVQLIWEWILSSRSSIRIVSLWFPIRLLWCYNVNEN